MYVLKISTTIVTNFSPSPHFSTIAQRHVSSIAAQDCVYVTNQGSVKSEVPWVQGYFWGCWFVDGRRADQTWGLLSYHDHGNLTVSNVQFFTWWLLVSFFEAWFFQKKRAGKNATGFNLAFEAGLWLVAKNSLLHDTLKMAVLVYSNFEFSCLKKH